MTSDLQVDYMLLEMAEKELDGLKKEFDDIEKRRDESSDFWGSDEVKDAMHEFASNMDYHRKKLSEKLDTVRSKVTTTLETFREADAELAKSFDEAS
ncbi:MAG: hypothetical protein ABWX74_17525 [Aeromicrobium sp.]